MCVNTEILIPQSQMKDFRFCKDLITCCYCCMPFIYLFIFFPEQTSIIKYLGIGGLWGNAEYLMNWEICDSNRTSCVVLP